MKKKTEQEIREQERQAILYALNQMEKSWKDVLEKAKAKAKDNKIAIIRIKGIFSGWNLIKDLLERRKSICKNPQNLKDEWKYVESLKKKEVN